MRHSTRRPPASGFYFPGSRPNTQALRTPGNEVLSPYPQSMPGAGVNQTTSAPAPDNVIDFPKIQRTFESSRYTSFQAISILIPAGQTIQLISEPSGIRGYLNVRSDATSIGTLAVALNQQPQSAVQASWIVNPGGEEKFETVVPQNRIYGTAIGGAVQVTITSANLSAPPGAA